MPDDDFSDSDRAALRELAKERERRKWLVDLLQRWAKWIVAISACATVVWDAANRLFTHFHGR